MRIATPAGDALKTYWRTAALIAAAGVAALVALLPLSSLATPGLQDTRLRLLQVPAAQFEASWTALVRSPAETQQAAVTQLFTILIGVAVAALVLAAVVIGSISAGRAAARAPEIAVRRAAGAARRDLRFAALLEGAAIAGAVLAAGSALGYAGARIAARTWPGWIAGWRFEPWLAVALVGGVIVAGVLTPLWFARPARITDEGERVPSAATPALQLGMSLTVLLASALVLQRANQLMHTASAVARDGAIFELDTGPMLGEQRARQFAALLHRLGADRSVTAASLTSPGEVAGLGTVDVATLNCGTCPLGGIVLPWRTAPATYYVVSADTFKSRGLQVLDGRGLTADDGWGSKRVAVVNRQMAKRYFQQGRAVGRNLRVGASWVGELYSVVGIVDDDAPVGFGSGLQPREAVYLSVLQHPPTSAELLVRTANGDSGSAAVAAALRGAGGIRGDPSRPVAEAARLAREVTPLDWFGRWFAIEGRVLLAIAVLGVFSSMWLWVRALVPELALRRAVGARRRHIVGFVLVRAAAVAASGAAIGLFLFGVVLSGPLSAVVAGLPLWDSPAVARYALLLAGAALVGAAMPLVRAARTAPATLLTAR